MGLKTGFNHLQGVESKWALRPRVYQMPIQDGCFGCTAAEMWREFHEANIFLCHAYPVSLPWGCRSQNVKLIHHHTVPRWAINKLYHHSFMCPYELCLDIEIFPLKLKTADTSIITINSLYIQAWDMSKCLLWLWCDGTSPAFWQIINQ